MTLNARLLLFGAASKHTYNLYKHNQDFVENDKSSMEYEVKHSTRCPHCGEGTLKSWHELTADEREVTGRLPNATSYTLKERQKSHRWCTRCWFESTESSADA